MAIRAISLQDYTKAISVVINAKNHINKKHPYLYNEILQITKDYKVPATFHNSKIQLPSATKQVLAELNRLNIRYE